MPQTAEPFELLTADNGVVMLRIAAWMRAFPWLNAGFTTRHGGCGREPWNTLNTALHVGDNESDVAENRRRAAEAAGLDFAAWTCAEQVHGKEAFIVGRHAVGAGRLSREDAIMGKDALITDLPGVMLVMFYADCVPIWLVDPITRSVALAHAGWRGSVADVAGETVRTMQQAYGSNPADLHAAIGPSIRGCCYEVDERVARHIPKGSEALMRSTSEGRWMLDLAKYNRQKLTEAGILAKNIEISLYCTSCRTDLFFSHRKERGSTGRMAAWIAQSK